MCYFNLLIERQDPSPNSKPNLPSFYLHKTLNLLQFLTSLLLITLNIYSLPHVLKTLYVSYSTLLSSKITNLRDRKRENRTPDKEQSRDAISHLPIEISLLILLRLDLHSLQTLSRTSHHFHTLITTPDLWRLKCMSEFPLFTLFSPETPWSKSYLAAKKSTHPRLKFGRRIIPCRRRPFNASLIHTNRQRSLALLHHIPLTPIKILGYALTPLNILLSFLLHPKSRKLTCIHLISLDLLTTASHSTSIWKRHIYASATLLALVFATIEGVTTIVRKINQSNSMLKTVLLVYLNIHVNLVPYYLVGRYPLIWTVAQVMWVPVSTASIESLNEIVGVMEMGDKLVSGVGQFTQFWQGIWEFSFRQAWRVVIGWV
jgi:hypothetical protein